MGWMDGWMDPSQTTTTTRAPLAVLKISKQTNTQINRWGRDWVRARGKRKEITNKSQTNHKQYQNKTIKDGDISPWLIWNNLSTWSYGKIWTKRKENNTEKILNHKKGEDGQAFLFFAAGLSAFSAQAVPIQNVFLPMLQQSLTVLESWTILDFLNYLRPFGTISDHFLTILDRFMTFLLILWHFLNISWPSWTFFNITWYFLIILDHFLNILNHFLIFFWYFLTISWHFLAILDHFWEGISRNDLQF